MIIAINIFIYLNFIKCLLFVTALLNTEDEIASKKYKVHSRVPALKGNFIGVEGKTYKHIVQIYYKGMKEIKRNGQKMG